MLRHHSDKVGDLVCIKVAKVESSRSASSAMHNAASVSASRTRRRVDTRLARCSLAVVFCVRHFTIHSIQAPRSPCSATWALRL